jgi:hypothetical protein
MRVSIPPHPGSLFSSAARFVISKGAMAASSSAAILTTLAADPGSRAPPREALGHLADVSAEVSSADRLFSILEFNHIIPGKRSGFSSTPPREMK